MNTKQVVAFAIGVAVGFYVVPKLMGAASRVAVN